jgi:hypothetical protein
MNVKRAVLATLLFLGVGVSTWAGVRPWPWVSEPGELDLVHKDETLVATLLPSINNSPAIVETDSRVDEENKVVTLSFSIVQNRDLYVRSLRPCTVRWEVDGVRGDEYEVVLEGAHVDLTTEQLRTLLDRRRAASFGDHLLR